MSVTLGVMPDYADEAKAGLKISGVRDGGPAAKAGLKGNDSIIRIGGKPIATIYDYMESMKGYKPGDKLEVVVSVMPPRSRCRWTSGPRPLRRGTERANLEVPN